MSRLRRQWNSLRLWTARSLHSWTLWPQRRREQRRQELMQPLLDRLAVQETLLLNQLALATQRLEALEQATHLLSRQLEQLPVKQELALVLESMRLEQVDLLTEVLNSLQPSAETQIAQLVGPSRPPTSSVSSAS